MAGPKKPPRLPTEFINPTDAAAADSPSIIVGSTQNEGAHAHNMRAVRQSQTIVSGKDCPGMMLSAKNAPDRNRGTAVCHLRSRNRSDDLPMYQTEIVA